MVHPPARARGEGGAAALAHRETRHRQLSGLVGGGGTWLIDAEELWAPLWDVGDRTRADQRIWRVRYGGFSPRGPLPPIPGLADSRALLEQALEEISRFAAAQALEWSQRFADALQVGRAQEEYERVSAALFTALTSAICAAANASAAQGEPELVFWRLP